ncbi:MAG: hypothetical protein IPP22_15060 [Nitrosomonas sp.]|nr:hypothetical protein [Nitrosomonas sp.]
MSVANVAAKEYAGVYCLRTNMMDWDAEKLLPYRTSCMTDLEAVFFRSLKSELWTAPCLPSNDPTRGRSPRGSHCLPITWGASHPFALKSCDIHDR